MIKQILKPYIFAFSGIALLFAPLALRAQGLTNATAAPFAALALSCIQQEYPNKISHVLTGEHDIKSPRELHPAFYGCYDWHSSVHGHWMIVRLLRLIPNASFRDEAVLALDHNLNIVKIAGEVGYLDNSARKSYERPYGLAWLLQLTMELRDWAQDQSANLQERELAAKWLFALKPLEEVAVEKLQAWLPNLSYPIRLGTHSQTAFAFGLILDWARQKQDEDMEALMVERINTFYRNDVTCPLAYEPSGEDFLSPCLMEADLMRRVMDEQEYATWLRAFLPQTPEDGSTDWLVPAFVTDVTDGKIVHLDGLNLSRAWALQGIAAHLPDDDPRIHTLHNTARAHAFSGLQSVTGEHYEGGHWLASFATYLITRRGLSDEVKEQRLIE